MLSRDKDFIVLYRGKDFLPSAVSSAIEERRRHVIHVEKQGAECSKSKKTAQEVIVEDTKSGSESKINSAKDQRSNFFGDPKNMKSAEAAIRKTDVKLSMVLFAKMLPLVDLLVKSFLIYVAFLPLQALEKKAKAEKLLAELEQAEIPQQSEIDKEGITQEERYMLRKVGLRMKPFLLLGELDLLV